MQQTWSIPCRGRTLELGHRTLIMGILNVTPDSFSDGGRYQNSVDLAVQAALQMIDDGAEIIDIGGESTRPGHIPVDADEEIRRVVPVIERLREHAPDIFISIDSMKAQVAEAALNAGADIINDVWGLQRDPEMARVASKYQVPTMVMHNQDHKRYTDLVADVTAFLRRSIEIAVQAGLSAEYIIIDPGIGFGKTVAHNLDLLRDMAELKRLGRPILLGTSRKSTIGAVLGGLPPAERVEGTAATVALGIERGADIVRVHDVKAMKRVAMMTDAIIRPNRGGFLAE